MYAAKIFGIFYSQWDCQMAKISRILKFLTWHGFDEFGWNDLCLNAKLSKKIIKKENVLLAFYSHFKQALEEFKNSARIFSINFENNFSKNETQELASNVITTHNFEGFIWWSWGKYIKSIFVIVKSSYLLRNFFHKK